MVQHTGHVGATEVQQVLLGLVGGDEHRRPPWTSGSVLPGLDAEEALERVDARARAPPVLVAVPLELGLHRLGHAPAVREAELGEHGARGREAEVLDEVLAQQPHRDGVEQQRALPGEADHAPLGVQLQELLVVQVLGSHRDRVIQNEGHSTSIRLKLPRDGIVEQMRLWGGGGRPRGVARQAQDQRFGVARAGKTVIRADCANLSPVVGAAVPRHSDDEEIEARPRAQRAHHVEAVPSAARQVDEHGARRISLHGLERRIEAADALHRAPPKLGRDGERERRPEVLILIGDQEAARRDHASVPVFPVPGAGTS